MTMSKFSYEKGELEIMSPEDYGEIVVSSNFYQLRKGNLGYVVDPDGTACIQGITIKLNRVGDKINSACLNLNGSDFASCSDITEAIKKYGRDPEYGIVLSDALNFLDDIIEYLKENGDWIGY